MTLLHPGYINVNYLVQRQGHTSTVFNPRRIPTLLRAEPYQNSPFLQQQGIVNGTQVYILSHPQNGYVQVIPVADNNNNNSPSAAGIRFASPSSTAASTGPLTPHLMTELTDDSANMVFVLFQLRGDRMRHSPGLICLPGGTRDPGEDIKRTTIREVKEETNVDIQSRHMTLVYRGAHGTHYFLHAGAPFSMGGKPKSIDELGNTKQHRWPQWYSDRGGFEAGRGHFWLPLQSYVMNENRSNKDSHLFVAGLLDKIRDIVRNKPLKHAHIAPAFGNAMIVTKRYRY